MAFPSTEGKEELVFLKTGNSLIAHVKHIFSFLGVQNASTSHSQMEPAGFGDRVWVSQFDVVQQ